MWANALAPSASKVRDVCGSSRCTGRDFLARFFRRRRLRPKHNGSRFGARTRYSDMCLWIVEISAVSDLRPRGQWPQGHINADWTTCERRQAGCAPDLRQDFRAGGNPQRNWEIRNAYFPINSRLAAGSTVCVNSPVPVGSVNSIRTSLPMPWMYL